MLITLGDLLQRMRNVADPIELTVGACAFASGLVLSMMLIPA